jgi:hypothetical protein
MTQDEIIEMARQAGIQRDVLTLGRNLELLTDFAKLVTQHEREACAKLCEKHQFASIGLANAIRTRGQA